jgi:hypothetical protein
VAELHNKDALFQGQFPAIARLGRHWDAQPHPNQVVQQMSPTRVSP